MARPKCGRCNGPNGKWYRKILGEPGLICDKCREAEQQRTVRRDQMTDRDWRLEMQRRLEAL